MLTQQKRAVKFHSSPYTLQACQDSIQWVNQMSTCTINCLTSRPHHVCFPCNTIDIIYCSHTHWSKHSYLVCTHCEPMALINIMGTPTPPPHPSIEKVSVGNIDFFFFFFLPWSEQGMASNQLYSCLALCQTISTEYSLAFSCHGVCHLTANCVLWPSRSVPQKQWAILGWDIFH